MQKYELHIDTPMGVNVAILELIENGGTLTDENGAVECEKLSVTGDDISFVVKVKTPVGKMKMTMELHVNGNEVSGTSKMVMGSLGITGKKLQ